MQKDTIERMFSSIFKRKDSSPSADTGDAKSPTAQPVNRRRVAQLTDAEKSQRRSTIGPVAGVQMAASLSSTSVQKVEIDTQFSKMVKTNSAVGAPKSSTSDSASTLSPSNSRSSLTAEEKRQRRKSLLAPVDKVGALTTPAGSQSAESLSAIVADPNAAASGAGTGRSISTEQLKAGRLTGTNLFKKDNLEDLSFSKLTVEATATNAADQKLQKHKQKQLQKQMDKEVKKAEKQEKLMETRALEILNQTLELGKTRATMPEPQARVVVVPPSRPPRLLISV